MAKLLLRHLTDPQLTMATISGVEVSPDLQHARVYVSRVGSAAEQQAAIMSLQHATGFMQGHLGKRLHLRSVPELDFQLETAIAHGVSISSLLQALRPRETHDEGEDDA
jgi:ribosome-binding factor A